jgi:hypothetical protein
LHEPVGIGNLGLFETQESHRKQSNLKKKKKNRKQKKSSIPNKRGLSCGELRFAITSTWKEASGSGNILVGGTRS